MIVLDEVLTEDRLLPVLTVAGAVPGRRLGDALLGMETVKLFPANVVGGPAAVRALAGPIPALRFVPTGGVGLTALPSYLALPAVLSVGGSWLAPRDVVTAEQWDEVTRRTRAALQQINDEVDR